MNHATEHYQGRTYHAFSVPHGTTTYAEGTDIKRAFSIPHNAVPPVVRAALLTKLGTPSVAVR